MTSKPYSGGCQCGAVRYTCSADAIAAVNCHCSNCQKSSGSSHVPWFIVPHDAVSFSGEAKFYETGSDSGRKLRRAHCPACGTPVYGLLQDLPVVAITAISLDDASWFTPQADIFTASARPWVKFDPDLPNYAGPPPMHP